MKKVLLLCAVFSLLLASCVDKKPEPDYDEGVLAPLSVEFDNIVGGMKLYLGSSEYLSGAGEVYSVDLLKYFISNIKVYKADGTEYIVPQDDSYFLIDAAKPESRFARVMVPEGDYTRLVFTLGVDSLRNTMDVDRRTGVLDPASEDGMYWGWNSGYIFFKMEGLSEAAPVEASGQRKFRYHIGGFGGYSSPTINNIKMISVDLREAGEARVRQDRNSNIHLMVDIGQVLSGENTILISENPTVMFSEFSTKIADNYENMFTHDHTEN